MTYSSGERERLKRELQAWAAKIRERDSGRRLRKRGVIESRIRAQKRDQIPDNLCTEVQGLQEVLSKIPSRVEPISLNVLDLPARVSNALARIRALSFKDLKELGAVGFAELEGIGTTSIRALQSEIVNVIRGFSEGTLELPETTSPRGTQRLGQVTHQEPTLEALPTLHELWLNLLRAAGAAEGQTTPNLEVITARYGLRDGVRHTLEEVGQRLGVTRERIRQREASVVKRLRNPTYLAFRKASRLIREHLESHYVAPLSAIIGQGSERDVDLRGMARLVTRVSGAELDVVGGFWIARLGGASPKLAKLLSQAVDRLPAQLGWKDAALVGRNLMNEPNLADEVAVGILVIGLPAEVVFGSDGRPVAIRHRAVDLAEAVYIVLRETEGPLTLREMGERVLERFRKWSSNRIEQKIGTAILDDYRFVQVGNGTYDLSSRFPVVANEQRAMLDATHEVLAGLGKPTDTSFLLRKIRQRINVPGAVNRYSLFWMLKSDQRFLVPRRLHVGLQEWRTGIQSTPFAAALVSVLEEAKVPLTEREVHKRLLSTRSPQLYGVSQGLERLARQGRVLKVAPQTYAALSSLQVPQEASEAIKAGLDGYVAEYGLPIVARFLRDTLVQQAPMVGNLSDAHVDYVLGTDEDLVRIGYGVYVPIDVAGAWRRDPISAHATYLLKTRDEAVQAAELLWILEEAHQLQGARIWERLLRVPEIQLYPFGYLGLREWGAAGWRRALETVWDKVIGELRTIRDELPSWLDLEAAKALRDLAQARGETWVFERFKLESYLQSPGTADRAPVAGFSSSDPREGDLAN